jgi:hypothetical protein
VNNPQKINKNKDTDEFDTAIKLVVLRIFLFIFFTLLTAFMLHAVGLISPSKEFIVLIQQGTEA